MTNLGQHALDIVHWFLEATAPTAVTSVGGRFALKDNGETPDTQDVLFEYPGWTATWSQRECSRGADPSKGTEFCGTRGSMKISRQGFVVTPDPKVAPDEIIPRFGAPHPVGGPATTGQREVTANWTEAKEDHSGNEFDQFKRHARNFLECIRSRHEPISGFGGGTPRRHRVPSGKPFAPAGPKTALGPGARDRRERSRSNRLARTTVQGALGRRAQCPSQQRVTHGIDTTFDAWRLRGGFAGARRRSA